MKCYFLLHFTPFYTMLVYSEQCRLEAQSKDPSSLSKLLCKGLNAARRTTTLFARNPAAPTESSVEVSSKLSPPAPYFSATAPATITIDNINHGLLF
uniref:Uncharacterized protein n=1 Tax=Triticum urartu TaxID=4572 RepID=A0A8R7PBL3_TRIUA